MPKRGDTTRRPDKTPLIQAADVHAYLIEKAAEIAFGDVVTLVDRRPAIEARVAQASREHRGIADRVRVSMMLLEDHLHQKIPQIPYHTIAVLTVALFYLIEEVDLIPDFIPSIGSADDALVLTMACEIAAPGLERYATWKDLKLPWLKPTGESPVKPKAPARRGAKT